VDWGLVWEFLWPILRQGLIALLMALLAVLGYDKVVPSRFERDGGAASLVEGLKADLGLTQGRAQAVEDLGLRKGARHER
jgi:hypothetical protein